MAFSNRHITSVTMMVTLNTGSKELMMMLLLFASHLPCQKCQQNLMPTSSIISLLWWFHSKVVETLKIFFNLFHFQLKKLFELPITEVLTWMISESYGVPCMLQVLFFSRFSAATVSDTTNSLAKVLICL